MLFYRLSPRNLGIQCMAISWKMMNTGVVEIPYSLTGWRWALMEGQGAVSPGIPLWRV